MQIFVNNSKQEGQRSNHEHAHINSLGGDTYTKPNSISIKLVLLHHTVFVSILQKSPLKTLTGEPSIKKYRL